MSYTLHYILNEDHSVVVEPDVLRWADWYEKADRLVAATQIGLYRVSTVFLSINHNFQDSGPPILFETMVFPSQDRVARYETWNDAVEGHERMCNEIRILVGKDPE